MTSRKPAPAAISLALALLERLAVCRDQLKMAADQLRESCDDDGRFTRRAGNGPQPDAAFEADSVSKISDVQWREVSSHSGPSLSRHERPN
jgi:hypothetical protein